MPGLPRNAVLAALAAVALGASYAFGADGLPVCTAAGPQWNPVVAAKPGGGAWVAWLDRRNGYSTDVYDTRLDAAGTPATNGTSQGTALTLVTCLKESLVLVADGTGGALAVWADDRCGETYNHDIFALRLDAAGLPVAGWPANGAPLEHLPGEQIRPAAAPDGAGGVIVAWVDRSASPARLFAGHVRADGSPDPAWPADGLLVAAAVSDSAAPSVALDGEGGCYVAWDDRRTGELDVRVTRLAGSGVAAGGWTLSGTVAGGFPGDQWRASLLAGAGGAFVAWLDRRSGTPQLYATRLLPSGARAPGWAVNGNHVAASGFAQYGLAVAPADLGGAVLAWQEDRGTGSDVYAQHVDSIAGIPAGWPSGGVTACGAAGAQVAPVVVADGAGGCFVAWSDARDVASGLDLYVTRLGADGARSAGWPVDGASLSRAPGDQRELRLASDGTGGAFAVWTDGRNAGTTADDISARRILASGPVTERISGLKAVHHNGQTFLAWDAPPGLGWKYRVYASASPITSAAGLATAQVVGSVGDSSACDKRISRITGALTGFRTAPEGPDLAPGSGLFVRTPAASGAGYYAVTAQPGAFGEDTTVVPGANALLAAVVETLAVPRPVFQRTVPVSGWTTEVWSLWAGNEDRPGFPAMSPVASLPFDCGIVRGGASGAALVVKFHALGGNFAASSGGALIPYEWVLSLDDQLPNGRNTFWYGYPPNYDVYSTANAPPTLGTVVDYTARRIDWTLGWALREFPVDSTRVFTYGYSMGAMGATQLALRTPGRVAGVMAVIGQYDYSFQDDPVAGCWFNPGGSYRLLADEMWGKVAANLPAPDGVAVFEHLNGRHIADGALAPAGADLPPIMAFNGRKDLGVGWAEKVTFWGAMQDHHRGGWFYWDPRNHGALGALWTPMQTPSYLDRLRTNRSFPAFSRCDADGVLGDGTPATGDSIGTLNGYVEWTLPVDEPAAWSVVLTLRPLQATTGTWPAPDSVLVDVTPRRVQHFVVAPYANVPWRAVRVADEAVLGRGNVAADSAGAVTVPLVRVLRTGTRLELGDPALAAVVPGARRLRLECAPLARGAEIAAAVTWPAAGRARLELLDVAGRRVLTLFAGSVPAGDTRYAVPRGPLAPGLYFVRASAGGEQAVRRVVVLR